jgi:hypothetical protein
MRDTTKAVPVPFKVSPAAQADRVRIADFNLKLQAAISARDFSFNAQALDGTQGITTYNYRIEYKDIVQQSFSIMDIPGGWLSGNRPEDQWEQYAEHLHKSIALWVPVESPLLMEAVRTKEKRKGSLFLMMPNVRDVVEDWAKYREMERNEPAVLCMAPIKCETYFSRAANKEIPEKFFDAFIREYAEIVNLAKEICPRGEVFYTPVESIGCVKLEKMDWRLASDDEPPVISYKVLDPYYQVIAGVEGLTGEVYRYGAQRINEWLETQHHEVLNTHDTKQREYDNRGFFTWFFDLFGGAEEKQDEIAKLQKDAELKAEELRLLGDVLAKLADRSEQSPYFRKL